MAAYIKVSKRKAEGLSLGLFFIALGIIYFFEAWWPGILLAVWVLIGTRQVLTNRHFDFFVSTVILIGLFLVSLFHISWSVLGPLMFVLGGVYIILAEFFFREHDEVEVITKRDVQRGREE